MSSVEDAPRPARAFRGDVRYLVCAILVGTIAGLIGSAFHLSIDALAAWPQWLADVLHGRDLILAGGAITMAATVLCVMLVRLIAPEAGGSGVQEIEGALEGMRPVRWLRVLPLKFVTGILAISSGLVLGREGPTIHIGASVAQGVSVFGHLTDLERRGLLAAGAAAGLACAFNAPLAAVLFVIEETRKQFPYTLRTYMGVIIASVISAALTEYIAGVGPDFRILVPEVSLGLLPTFLPLGIAIGILGVLLNRAILRALDICAAWHRRVPYSYPALVGFLSGAALIAMPAAVTGGERVIMILAVENYSIAALLFLAALRFFSMVGGYSTGVPGGIFAPILTLAICVGLAFGTGVETIMPGFDATPTAFGIAAMGALFTASVRAPIVGVALALELTGSYTLVMPLLITCFAANIVAEWCGGRPIYEQLLERTMRNAGIRPTPAREPTGLA
ncbi:H(+)/Cl(-) exchange transporter ClcA [Acuticoccus kandeliae]|uniref:H(+)/Cl(-) exchange transporter ClcA n=1 Tax=Acuticoccus kandeliae TaxID=2073160 RepID=UPI000D3E8E83|nr:H(+)/Cl(-) exchange transporter ClcA [Acuticoccus kandeliae]